MSACWPSSSSSVAGGCIANEMAPRVHNSGHWTIEGAVTSQFENHVRAIAGLPLGDTRAARACGDDQPDRNHAASSHRLLAEPGLHLHDYGKEPRHGRKLGHCTIIEASARRRDLRAAQYLLNGFIRNWRSGRSIHLYRREPA